MKKLLAVMIVMAMLVSFAMADTNSGMVTKKGTVGLVLDYAGSATLQTQGKPSSKPYVDQVIKYGVVYGLMDNIEVGLVKVDTTPQFPAAYVTPAYIDPSYILSAAYGLNNLLGNLAMGADVKGVFEYAMPKKVVIHQNMAAAADDYFFSMASTSFAIKASKEMLAKGLILGGSLGVINRYNTDVNEDNLAAMAGVNRAPKTSFTLSFGADYMITNTICSYLTVNHVDNSSLVGVEDGLNNKARNDSMDSIVFGLRYDI